MIESLLVKLKILNVNYLHFIIIISNDNDLGIVDIA